jgi:hypothetical protein
MSVATLGRDEKDLTRIVGVIGQLAEGRSNAVGTVTLAANAASTVVPAQNCGAGSTVLLMPLTAHAATEVGNGTIYIAAVTNGAFTIAHANNAQTDRRFGWAALG